MVLGIFWEGESCYWKMRLHRKWSSLRPLQNHEWLTRSVMCLTRLGAGDCASITNMCWTVTQLHGRCLHSPTCLCRLFHSPLQPHWWMKTHPKGSLSDQIQAPVITKTFSFKLRQQPLSFPTHTNPYILYSSLQFPTYFIPNRIQLIVNCFGFLLFTCTHNEGKPDLLAKTKWGSIVLLYQTHILDANKLLPTKNITNQNV